MSFLINFPMPGEPEVATRHSGVKANVKDWEIDGINGERIRKASRRKED